MMNQVMQVAAKGVAFGMAEHVLGGGIEQCDRPLRVDTDNGFADRQHHLTRTVFGEQLLDLRLRDTGTGQFFEQLMPLGLGATPFTNIVADPQYPGDLSGGVQQRHLDDFKPHHAPARIGALDIKTQCALFGNHAPVFVFHTIDQISTQQVAIATPDDSLG